MTLLADFETVSDADLRAVGGRNYAAHPSTEVLCAVVHDVETEQVGVWFPTDQPVTCMDTPVAHNAQDFDRHVAARVGWCTPPWSDTSVAARRAGLPGALDALGTRWLGRAKDKIGSEFTKSLSKYDDIADAPIPFTAEIAAIADKRERAKRRAAQLKEWRKRPAAERREAVMRIVVNYCHSDVEIMVHGWPRLRSYLEDGVFGGWEGDVLQVDGVVNDRGICLDADLARRLLAVDAENSERVIQDTARVLRWTSEAVRKVVGSPAQLSSVLGLADAQAETVENVIRHEATEEPWRVALCRARQAIATIAGGKLEAGLARVSPDGRLRDNQRYYGAHTGRWSGRGMQLQNLPRPDNRFEKWGHDEVERYCAGETVMGDTKSGPVPVPWGDPDGIMVALRACLTASPGNELAVCDFSGVEARWLAWVAGDEKALEVFRSGRDPYKVAASVIFALEYDTIEKNSRERDIGKKSELACLAGDTVVLTDHGPKTITEVCESDRLWDGMTWVTHRGLIHRGIREVVDSCGVMATPDHLVWCGTRGWCPFGKLDHSGEDRYQALAIASGSLRSPAFCAGLRDVCSPSSYDATAGRPSTRSIYTIFARVAQHVARSVRQRLRESIPSNGGDMRRSSRTMRTVDACVTGFRRFFSAVTTRSRPSGTHTAGEEFTSIGRGEKTVRRFLPMWLVSMVGIGRSSISTGETTIAGTSRATSDLSHERSIRLTSGPSSSSPPECAISRPVYDLAYAGPRNRFMILTSEGPLLVHNCGYGMGPKKFEERYEPSKVGVDAKDVVAGWRELHAPIVRHWRDLENAFVAAVRGKSSHVGPYEFVPSSDGKDVAVFLPSGRPIVYNAVGLSREITSFGRERFAPYYVGTRGGREHLYGGKIAENVTQAGCRDLMAVAMVAAERAGLPVVLTVHDEIVVDVPRGREGYDELKRIMLTLPEWAIGFPVGASGHWGFRYRK